MGMFALSCSHLNCKGVFFIGVISVLMAMVAFHFFLAPGMIITPDSVKYLNSADNILKGYGVSLGTPPAISPNTHWAPGYSVALAIPCLFGADLFNSAKIIAVFCYIFILITSTIIIYKYTGSFLVAVLSEAMIAFHPVILDGLGSLLSEPLSWVFLLVMSITASMLIIDPSVKWAIFNGISAGGGVLVRYAFFGFLAGNSLSILLLLRNRLSRYDKFKLLSISFFLSLTIISIWFLRNFILVGSLGYVKAPAGSLIRNFLLVARAQWSTFLGITPPPRKPFVLFILLPLFAFLFIGIAQYRKCILLQANRKNVLSVFFLINFICIYSYMLFIVLFRTFVAEANIENRMFSPVVINLIMMLAAGVAMSKKISIFKTRVKIGLLAYALLFCLICFQGAKIFEASKHRSLWYNDRTWKNSHTLTYVSKHFDIQEVMASDPEVFWLWHGKYSNILPMRWQDKKIPASSFKNTTAFCWFKMTHRRYLVSPDDFIWGPNYQKLEFNDGVVYVKE